MIKFVIYILLSAAVICGSQNCDYKQKIVMKKQWAPAYQKLRANNETIGVKVWSRMFDQSPDMEKFIRFSTGITRASRKFRVFVDKIMGGFDICISLIDDGPLIENQLQHLQKYHIKKAIPSRYFDVMLQTIMAVVSEVNESPVDEAAWNECGSLLMTGMQDTLSRTKQEL